MTEETPREEGDQGRQETGSLSYDEIYSLHFERIFAFLMGRLADRDRALDLTQEVFLRLIKTNPRPSSIRENVVAYLYGIARNVTADFLAAKGKLSLTDLEKAGPIPEPFREPQFDTFGLERCVGKLKEIDRRILDSHFHLGENHREIAGRLGLSHGNVRIRFHRALQQLRQCMQKIEARL